MSIISSAIFTSILIPAQETSVTSEITQDILLSDNYKLLSKSEKQDFNALIQSGMFSYQDLQNILHEKLNGEPTFRSKVAIVKKAARLHAQKLGQKSLAEITDFLFGWQDNLEEGMARFLLRSGWNKDVAYWTAISIMFILF
ncbi:hypothetical protein IU403_03585 [Aerococcaceae bacterium zg-BR22]|uniref:hypothetical protein n=1 Tax=Aerococcaceae bacterium zg-1292 TaxID=2774330 RepID=UPI0040640E49|nr:hypothetical protein [Aerococcaceae bacterium zg-BR22]